MIASALFRIVWLAAATLSLAAPALAASAALPAAAGEPWFEIRTRRFQVFSNGSEQAAIHAARHMERLAEALEATTGGLRTEGGRAVRVYIFRNEASFRPYSSSSDDDQAANAGYHIRGEDTEYIAFFTPAGETGLDFASHEYLHTVLSLTLGYLPIWINEGIAEYYSTFAPGLREAMIGRPISRHVSWLRERMIPLEDLFLISFDSPEYRRGQHRTTIYAQSWLLVHTLMMDPVDSARRFGQLVTELSHGTGTGLALRRIYGPNAVDSLHREIRERLGRGSLPVLKVTFSRDFETLDLQKRGLDPIETRTVLGELLAHADAPSSPLARQHLLAAWTADSTRAIGAALLGLLAERAGDRPEADRWFERVDRAERQDPRALGLAGSALARRGLDFRPLSWPAAGASSEVRRARSLLERAIKDQPDAVAWDIPLAITFLDDSEVSVGMGALFQAQETWPNLTQIGGMLGVLALRSGNRGAATQAFETIPPGPDRVYWRTKLGSLLLQDLQTEMNRLVREGKTAEAESLVTRARARLDFAGARSALESMLSWIRERAGDSGAKEARTEQHDSAAASHPPTAKAPSSRPAPAPDPLAPVHRAMSSGDYVGAERLVEAMGNRPGGRVQRARLDSLAAEARCRRRLSAATALVGAGSFAEACALLDMILADKPPAAIRREARSQKLRSCKGGP